MALDTVVSNWNAEHRCGDEREALLSRPRQALGTIEEKDWRMLEISAWALGGRANSSIRTKLCPSVALRHAVYRELEYLVRALVIRIPWSRLLSSNHALPTANSSTARWILL